MLKGVQDLTLKWLHQKICFQKVSVKTRSDISSRQMTHPLPPARRRTARALAHYLLLPWLAFFFVFVFVSDTRSDQNCPLSKLKWQRSGCITTEINFKTKQH